MLLTKLSTTCGGHAWLTRLCFVANKTKKFRIKVGLWRKAGYSCLVRSYHWNPFIKQHLGGWSRAASACFRIKKYDGTHLICIKKQVMDCQLNLQHKTTTRNNKKRTVSISTEHMTLLLLLLSFSINIRRITLDLMLCILFCVLFACILSRH